MDPLQQLDQELEQAFSSMHRSGSRIVRDMRMRANSGPSTRTQAAQKARRTKAPGRRQLARMTPGQLSGYMVSVHTRGQAGEKVGTEARRISAELGRREMSKTQGQWNTMGRQWPPEAGFDRAPSREAAAAPVQTNESEVAAARDAANAAQANAADARDDAIKARQEADASRSNAERSSSSQNETSPMDAVITTAATVGTIAAVDEVIEAVDSRADELGVDTITDSLPAGGEDLANDLLEDGADQELVDAADFGNSAVAGGDVAEALGTESVSQDKTMDLGNESGNEMPSVTPSPAQGAEI